MLTIPKEELHPVLDEHFGSIGRIIMDENGDPTGHVYWFLANSQEQFDKCHALPDKFKTIRTKRLPDLVKILRTRQREKPAGSTTLIEIPKLGEEDFKYYGHRDVDRSPKILELNSPHFRTVGNAIRHMIHTGQDRAWIYKGGDEPPKRSWNNVGLNGEVPGIFSRNQSRSISDIMESLSPESLHVERAGRDITQEAISNGKSTIPLKGGYGLRAANGKGMGLTAVMLVKLTPKNFERAVDAAMNKAKMSVQRGGTTPMVYKWELHRLLLNIMEKTKEGLEVKEVGGKSYHSPWVKIECCDRIVQDIIYNIPPAFKMLEKITGLEKRFVEKADYSNTRGLVWDILTVWKSRECLYSWQKSRKYDGMDHLIACVEKYGKRCHKQNEAYKKRVEATKQARAEKRKGVKDDGEKAAG
jgi:hypothetical protein